jgi:superoxide dismutase
VTPAPADVAVKARRSNTLMRLSSEPVMRRFEVKEMERIGAAWAVLCADTPGSLTATSAGAGVTGGRRGQVASLGGHEGWVVKVEVKEMERIGAAWAVLCADTPGSVSSLVPVSMCSSSFSVCRLTRLNE